jgi:hypothetical protein
MTAKVAEQPEGDARLGATSLLARAVLKRPGRGAPALDLFRKHAASDHLVFLDRAESHCPAKDPSWKYLLHGAPGPDFPAKG